MRRHLLAIPIALFAISACHIAPARAANWQFNRVNHTVLTPPGGVTVNQLSGVTYLGLVAGAHRFAAAEQTRGELVAFDVAFSAAGGITSVSNIAAVPMSPLEDLEDYEGIAFTNPARNSVFLSDEDALGAGDRVGVREVSLATGAELQAVTIPPVFANRRPNRGLESLTHNLDGTVMWTANEQALSVDDLISTATSGTDVRLLKLNVTGDAVAASAQYAYRVEPIHGTSPIGSPQSGLSDLVAMPDGTLIALERSVAFLASPSTYLSRIYEVDFIAATDVSVGPAASGLIGQTFTHVGKQLLWSGPADGTNGQNLEGLTLGPRLANGDWILLGVVDDGWNSATNSDTDPASNNTLVAFTATAIPSADFNADGGVDGTDFLHWQRGLGQTVGATHAEGDADRDGDVDADDLTQWKADFAAPGEIAGAIVPEPASLMLGGMTLTGTCWRRLRRR
ncbi:MAG: esterase-like activity of phytase family protein [Pirellulales bacterium]|nr:esterase-like activity of phytase family protein [Pirellulales bacterium]